MQTITLTRQIILRLTLGVAERLRRLELLDVFALPTSPEEFTELIVNPQKLAAVIWEMSDQTAITTEQFLEWFSTSEPDKLREAVFAEIVDFFREPMRPVVAALIDSAKSADDVACSTMTRLIQTTPPSVVSVNETEFGSGFGSLEASSASIHEISHGDSSTTWPTVESVPSGAEQAA